MIPKSPFLDRLPPDQRQRLLTTAREVHFQQGTSVFEADNDEWTGVVLRGLVRILRRDDAGRTMTLRNVRAGGIVGLGALVGAVDIVAAAAVGNVDLLRFDQDVVRQLRHDPRFSIAVAKEIHDRLVDTTNESMLRLRGGLARRLALELLDRSSQPADVPLVVAATHEELADALGSAREVISRQLEVLGKQGLVQQVSRGMIRLNSPDGLLTFARGEP